MAAALAERLFAESGIDCTVRSAGVCATAGGPASANAIAVMQEEGCDLLTHRSQSLSEDLMTEARLILTMTAGHQKSVLSEYPKAADKVFTLYGYAGGGTDIADPFGGDRGVYRACADQIKGLLRLCVEKIMTEPGGIVWKG
jgi:protein-tyrosine-phosphatase